MAKSKKLTKVDMLYLDEYLKNEPKPNWELLEMNLGKPIDIIQDYANRIYKVEPEPVVSNDPKPVLTTQQENMRKQMNLPTMGGAQTVTVMTEATSAQIEAAQKFAPIRGAKKYDRSVFRGNK